ncbi:MAG: hypothetical protein L6R37_003212 [Teloschistes peruensis]|nr:MAG: hypothetical protein L6R37_003212 [Teloschistes peruensis]
MVDAAWSSSVHGLLVSLQLLQDFPISALDIPGQLHQTPTSPNVRFDRQESSDTLHVSFRVDWTDDWLFVITRCINTELP